MSDDRAERLKRGMRAAYDGAAPRYRRLIAPTFVPIGRRVVRLAHPNTDDVHLDLATGTGLIPALTDDRRIVSCIAPWRVAMDLSANMLRAAHEASPPTRLVQGDLERLPFRNGSVDLVTLSLALHHLPRPRRALAEIRRVLNLRGRLVLAAWSDEMSPLWRAFDVWFEGAGLGPARAVSANDEQIDTVERLRAALVTDGGFSAVEITRDVPEIAFPTLDDFWEWRISFPAPNRTFSAMTPEERERRRLDGLAALRPLAGEGTVRADMPVLFAVARP